MLQFFLHIIGYDLLPVFVTVKVVVPKLHYIWITGTLLNLEVLKKSSRRYFLISTRDEHNIVSIYISFCRSVWL